MVTVKKKRCRPSNKEILERKQREQLDINKKSWFNLALKYFFIKSYSKLIFLKRVKMIQVP